VSFWKIKGSTLKRQKGLYGNTKHICTAVTIGSIQDMNDSSKGGGGYHIVTGMANGQLYKWNAHKLADRTVAHTKKVTALWSYSDGLISGSADGTIVMWDTTLTQLRKVDVTLLRWELTDPTIGEWMMVHDDDDDWYMIDTWLIHDWYMIDTWLIHDWYMIDTRWYCSCCNLA
jgi:WD40 repeat protein